MSNFSVPIVRFEYINEQEDGTLHGVIIRKHGKDSGQEKWAVHDYDYSLSNTHHGDYVGSLELATALFHTRVRQKLNLLTEIRG